MPTSVMAPEIDRVRTMPPGRIDGARVLAFASCEAFRGYPDEDVAGLVIATRGPGHGFDLMRCDADWDCLGSDQHATATAALAQAEFEYAGVSERWVIRP